MGSIMQITQYIDALEREGRLLADAAGRIDFDMPIPTCPDWRMRDLVRHVGGVHRWAIGHIADRRTKLWAVDLIDVVGAWPADNELIAWFAAGLGDLIRTLASAPADLHCITFLKAASPLAMWARRQAHETAIHRVDAESPENTITGFNPDFAADGIDELVSCFITRPRRGPKVDSRCSIGIQACDTGDGWHLAIGPDSVLTSRRSGPADCSITATAAELYLLLWNRRSVAGIRVDGDQKLLGTWREGVRIRWK